MKLFLGLIFILVSLNIFAKNSNPLDFCHQIGNCTSKMLEITKEYKVGNGKFTKENLSAFSGSCYHISPLYDPDHEHHGAFYFENENKEFKIDGIFSFFFEADPYQDLNSEGVKELFLQRGSVPFKAIKKMDHAELWIKSTKPSDFHYWFKTNQDQSKMFLIGMQFSGTDPNFVFCELNNRN
jgi:hypothetical protein